MSKRILSELGFNAFTSAQLATQDAKRLLNPGSPYYIWRLSDGLFEWTAIPDPSGDWLEGATCVADGRTSRRRGRG